MREIRLLGEPAIRDCSGALREVRGQQAWAVLARILLSRKPLDRRQLSAEIFPEAADPLGALRWCLAALRRALDEPLAFRGDPIQPELPEDIHVDVRQLETILAVDGDPGDLLSGVDVRATIEFTTWLLVERERLAALVEAHLPNACLRAMSRGDAAHAIGLAEKGIRRNPFDESMHVLMVKALAMSGRMEAALTHADATERSFRAELGAPASPALRDAARRPAPATITGISPAAHARSLLEQGKAALSAGAADQGIDALRRACGAAEDLEDRKLRCDILIELGTALIHAVRGHDDEGAVLMQQAALLAEALGADNARASALRELGYVEALAGRRPSAAGYLSEALPLASEPDRLAGIQSVIGFNLVDWGRVQEGLYAYREALELARLAANRRREVWCLGLGSRGLLADGNPTEASAWLDRCLQLVEELRWVAFRPWAVALKAEAMLMLGHAPVELRPELESAFALSCDLHDPCWQGAVSRAIALSHEAENAFEPALRWISEASERTGHDANPFTGLLVDLLEDRARIARKAGQAALSRDAAQQWIMQAARSHMHGSVSRAAQFMKSE